MSLWIYTTEVLYQQSIYIRNIWDAANSKTSYLPNFFFFFFFFAQLEIRSFVAFERNVTQFPYYTFIERKLGSGWRIDGGGVEWRQRMEIARICLFTAENGWQNKSLSRSITLRSVYRTEHTQGNLCKSKTLFNIYRSYSPGRRECRIYSVGGISIGVEGAANALLCNNPLTGTRRVSIAITIKRIHNKLFSLRWLIDVNERSWV